MSVKQTLTKDNNSNEIYLVSMKRWNSIQHITTDKQHS